MQPSPPDQVVESPSVQVRPSWLWGLVAGLLPNAAIFLAIYSTSWVEDHVADRLIAGVLYAGPVMAAVLGVLMLRRRHMRRFGVGLLVAAIVTVTTWFVLSAVATAIMISESTPGA